jgi:hypothetical protein
MRRLIALLSIVVLAMAIMIGCSGKNEPSSTSDLEKAAKKIGADAQKVGEEAAKTAGTEAQKAADEAAKAAKAASDAAQKK